MRFRSVPRLSSLWSGIERVTSRPVFSMMTCRPVRRLVVKPDLWNAFIAVWPEMTGSLAILHRDFYDFTTLPAVRPLVQHHNTPFDGIPDILQCLLYALSLGVATGKCRAADGIPAIFGIRCYDDFENHILEMRWYL